MFRGLQTTQLYPRALPVQQLLYTIKHFYVDSQGSCASRKACTGPPALHLEPHLPVQAEKGQSSAGHGEDSREGHSWVGEGGVRQIGPGGDEIGGSPSAAF